MTTVVIMPGGFHPFHAGHMALYNSARRAFPDADVYVAATDDTSSRPFPFAVKEKLAQLAGVEAGHFVRVKSPFQALEIVSKYDPAKDQLIFVRSEKDEGQPPVPGRVKKDGTPGYLQPLLSAKKLEPFAKHAYMAYLPTVEFGPGFKSATEIRRSWPELDERQKTALVMSLYPRTQGNPKLAATVRKMLDTAIVGDNINESVGQVDFKKNLLAILKQKYPNTEFVVKPDRVESTDGQLTVIADTAEEGRYVGCFMWDVNTGPYKGALALAIKQTTDQLLQANPGKKPALFISGDNENPEAWSHIAKKVRYKLITDEDLEENQGWAATFTAEQDGQCAGGDPGGGMMASYQKRENQPVAEKKEKSKARDAELIKALQYVKQHYPNYAGDPEMAMVKWMQRSIKHSELNDQQHDQALEMLNSKIDALAKIVQKQKQIQNEDYIEEKWSQKYKRSIDCNNPRGFSQRAHCAGRKK